MARIGVDAFPLVNLHGGVNFYIFYLLDELIQLRPNDIFYLFAPKKSGELLYFSRYENVHIEEIAFASKSHSLWAQTSLAYACWKYRIELFWGTTQSIPLCKKKTMKTAIVVYDFVYLLFPETMAPYRKWYLRVFSRSMIRKADAVIAISKGTDSKLQRFYQRNSDLIVPPPLKPAIHFSVPDANFLRNRGLENKNYLFSVGTLEPRKNFQYLIETYLQTLQTHPLETVLPLAIAGSGGWKNQTLLERLNAAKKTYPNHFRILGRVSDEDLSLLLSGARYFLMVSQYEGYGMPIAEARMCHTRVLCLDMPEMREAAEEDAIFLEPEKWEEKVRPYFLRNSPLEKGQSASYPQNREKGRALSSLFDRLHFS